jgi:UDP-N-acetylmuramoyl-tripeptide--D-alanyl-D-alanine ligase
MKHLFDVLPESVRAAYADDSTALAPAVVKAVRPGDIITVKGSHSMMMERVIDALSSPESKTSQKMAS